MDISVFISDLLYEHDCVIIPGFGGFICNYRPAEIHPVLHIVSPPSKFVSFNRNLTTNDGLLVNYLAKKGNLSFQKSHELVSNWVTTSRGLLRNNETLNLRNIGRIYSDIEGNVQFTPDESVNYLKASFALKPLTAKPVLRGKEVDFTEKFVHETKRHIGKPNSTWRVAAAIALILGIGALGTMMGLGVEVKPLEMNQASVFSFLNHFSANKNTLKPIPVITEKTVVAEPTKTQPLKTEVAVAPKNEPVTVKLPEAATQSGYYIITGAFGESKNAENAKHALEAKFPGTYILTYHSNGLTKVGYLAGIDAATAHDKLKSARVNNPDYWLLKK